MNFLTHLFFANESVDLTKGLIIGNTFNASNLSGYNLEVLKGIAIDMQIRVLSEKHPAFNRSMQRISARYSSKHSSFIINVFYDHFLAKEWCKYSNVSLEEFSEKIYNIILINRSSLSYKVRKFGSEMISKKWLTSIRTIEGTHQYIKMLCKCERSIANLDQCLFELIENYQQYYNDFEEYFNSIREFMIEESIRFNENTNEQELFFFNEIEKKQQLLIKRQLDSKKIKEKISI